MKLTKWTSRSNRGWKTRKTNPKIYRSENTQVDLAEEFSHAFPDTRKPSDDSFRM